MIMPQGISKYSSKMSFNILHSTWQISASRIRLRAVPRLCFVNSGRQIFAPLSLNSVLECFIDDNIKVVIKEYFFIFTKGSWRCWLVFSQILCLDFNSKKKTSLSKVFLEPTFISTVNLLYFLLLLSAEGCDFSCNA